MGESVQQTEKQFSDAIVELARLCGWLVHRDPTWRATGADPGYPDLTLARAKEVIFAELKVGKNKVTGPQAEWGLALPYDSNDLHYRVWTPDDWPAIEEMLR